MPGKGETEVEDLTKGASEQLDQAADQAKDAASGAMEQQGQVQEAASGAMEQVSKRTPPVARWSRRKTPLVTL